VDFPYQVLLRVKLGLGATSAQCPDDLPKAVIAVDSPKSAILVIAAIRGTGGLEYRPGTRATPA
jgi:hypothetical protein